MKAIYVVTLSNCSRRKPVTDCLIVRAGSPEAAIASAKRLSIRLPGKSHGTAREACPIVDLGCKTKEQVFAMHEAMRSHHVAK